MEKNKTKDIREQTLGEEIANAISHGVMALFGVFCLIMFILRSNSVMEYVAGIIFGACIIILYTMSTLYHAFVGKTKRVFRTFDHLSIYFLIGGSFAPALLLLNINDFFGINIPNFGYIMFGLQWLLIIVGVFFKSIWTDKYIALHTIMFLLLGWSAVIFIRNLYTFDVRAFWLIMAGGISYTLGVVFFALSNRIKYSHFIWHLFVAGGTICHFIANILYIY